jgi:hypothetical protein
VLDLDDTVGLEGGGKLGPGLRDGACHSEGQNGEEEESALHVVFVDQSTLTVFCGLPERKVGVPSSCANPRAQRW